MCHRNGINVAYHTRLFSGGRYDMDGHISASKSQDSPQRSLCKCTASFTVPGAK
jgi:hypothetical protein